MCRLIIAVGRFEARRIAAAAAVMARGDTADHDCFIRYHPDGWGAVWRDPSSESGLAAARAVTPAADSLAASRIAELETDFLAIHVRRASDPRNVGLDFTHPLERGDDWYFMHNGSQPTVHRLLGLPRSRFDSAEYFDYVVPRGARTLDPAETLARLRAIPTDGANSGNAVAVHPERAYLIHWRSATDVWPIYFTMHEYRTDTARVIASEIIPDLAPAECWTPLAPDRILEFPFPARSAS